MKFQQFQLKRFNSYHNNKHTISLHHCADRQLSTMIHIITRPAMTEC